MTLFLDALPVVLPATTPLWFTLVILFLCVAFVSGVGYLLYCQWKADSQDTEDKNQPPERL